MNNVSVNYTDGISHIHVTGNLVRFDLITLQPHRKDDNGQPVYEITQRLVMPIEGFIQAFNLQEAIVQNLISKGLAQRNMPTESISSDQTEKSEEAEQG